MGVKKLKPITPGQRFRVVNDFEQVTAAKPEKSLVRGKTKSGGRNNSGRMTMRYVGGGHKQKVRAVDFKRDKFGIPATVKSIEYDPLCSAYLMLLVYADGEKRYSVAVNGVKVGQTLVSGSGSAPEVGNALYLSDIPLGTIISNIEMRPGQGAIIARSAGTFAQLLAREGKYAIIKMPSGETRMILTTCIATIGTVSNSESPFKQWLCQKINAIIGNFHSDISALVLRLLFLIDTSSAMHTVKSRTPLLETTITFLPIKCVQKL